MRWVRLGQVAGHFSSLDTGEMSMEEAMSIVCGAIWSTQTPDTQNCLQVRCQDIRLHRRRGFAVTVTLRPSSLMAPGMRGFSCRGVSRKHAE